MKRFSTREKVLLVCLALALGGTWWDIGRRYWIPPLTINTSRYTIYSSATPEQTEAVGHVADSLYDAYGTFLTSLRLTIKNNGTLKMKLFANRDEFRFHNRIESWAEAFYLKPYCYQYFSADESNPYHWMIHEATHQLNEEAADLSLSKWVDEGIADYFGSSCIISNKLAIGTIDTNTYPVWWVNLLATSGNLEADKQNGSVIPLRAIISGSGGPNIDESFNLYYLHWWSLMHFLLHGENGKYRDGLARVMVGDSGVEGFEKHIGTIETIEKEWHAYVRELKQTLRTQQR
jgi:Protein of unknown function (DUF1570)